MVTKGKALGTHGNGAGGQARTRLARAAIIEAARELFLQRGYAATTFGAISVESGIPSATVYRLFSSKLTLLTALLDVAIRGDEEIPLAQQPRVRDLIDDPDARRKVAGLAGILRDVNSTSASAYRILEGAASSDPNAAELLAQYTSARDEGQGMFTRALASRGALRPALGGQDAADVVHALASPEVYRLLVVDRGWSPQRYEQWLAATLIDQLLPPEPNGGEDEPERNDDER